MSFRMIPTNQRKARIFWRKAMRQNSSACNIAFTRCCAAYYIRLATS